MNTLVKKTCVALLQLNLAAGGDNNLAKIEKGVREAAKQGAKIILPSELFREPYFCKVEKEELFGEAHSVDKDPSVKFCQDLAKELKVWIPVSFFEKSGNQYYNSIAMVRESGDIDGVYRKSHIPDGPGYEEKFYFRPGNTGFKVWKTPYGTIGVGICWDQWFPECARAMVLKGADILFYPTAIGTEPSEPDLDTSKMWQRVMIGHSVANVVPIVAANRIGDENGQEFYGHSFISDHQGEILQSFGKKEEGVLVESFDLKKIQLARASMGFFRDRRPELYQDLVEYPD